VHHLAAAVNGKIAASAGFGGEVKIWEHDERNQKWVEKGRIAESDKTGELWAIALSNDGRYLAASAYDGRVRLWDLQDKTDDTWALAREYETKGSFGMCVAMVILLYLKSTNLLSDTSFRALMAGSPHLAMRMVICTSLTTIAADFCIRYLVSLTCSNMQSQR
jgi:WD40 repeat protein